MRKKVATIALAATMVMSMSSTVLAASWQKNDTGWWWQEDNGSYPTNAWQWIDGNKDGVAECYYFNESGYCLLNTTTPDGYSVNEDGAWVVDGTIQKKSINNTGIYGTYRMKHPEGTYLSEHPEEGVTITLYEKDGKTILQYNIFRKENIELKDINNRITKYNDFYWLTYLETEFYSSEMYGPYRLPDGDTIILYEKDGGIILEYSYFEEIELSEEDINNMVTKIDDTYQIVMYEEIYFKE